MRSVEQLIEAVEKEARRVDFPVDTPVYERAERDPKRPILFAGSLDAPICVFARDLGKDEVQHGQPLIGAGGRLVRSGLYRAMNGHEPPKTDKTLESVLGNVLLMNTVPYKPPGNKAYPDSVKERFRPFLEELLVVHWKGDRIITLGTEAFDWFARYADSGSAVGLWKREDRYELDLPCHLTCTVNGRTLQKPVVVQPLPHPSPLNQRWYKLFPGLLERRLDGR